MRNPNLIILKFMYVCVIIMVINVCLNAYSGLHSCPMLVTFHFTLALQIKAANLQLRFKCASDLQFTEPSTKKNTICCGKRVCSTQSQHH